MYLIRCIVITQLIIYTYVHMDFSDLHYLSRFLRDLTIQSGMKIGKQIAPTERMILNDIIHHKGTTVRDIVKRTGVAQSRVSTIVREMQLHDAIIITPNPHDKRQKNIQANPSILGLVATHKLDTAITDTLSEQAPHLSGRQKKEVLEHITALHSLLNRTNKDQIK